MMPIAYAISEATSIRFCELLHANGINVSASVDESILVSETGDQAFIKTEKLIETSFSLPGDQDMLLHAALMCSGARHYGNSALINWPKRMLVKNRETFTGSVIVGMLGPSNAVFRGTDKAGMLVVYNSSFLHVVRLSAEGLLESCIVQTRTEEKKNIKAWDSLKQCLTASGFREVQYEHMP